MLLQIVDFFYAAYYVKEFYFRLRFPDRKNQLLALEFGIR